MISGSGGGGGATGAAVLIFGWLSKVAKVYGA